MRTPYLVQRAAINRPLTEGRLSNVVNLDYMGSAEFAVTILENTVDVLANT